MTTDGPPGADFGHAPPPTLAEGLLAVPLHILAVRGMVRLDAATAAAAADATMDYVVGPYAGHPFFDLRQAVDRCWLDGREIDPAKVAAVDVGAGPACTVRMLRCWQASRSAHRLRLRYRLGTPQAELGGTYPPVLRWEAGPRLRWSFGLSDLFAGRYLEAWFPANLPFDPFPLTLDIAITGTRVRHSVISNGDVATRGERRWTVTFPRSFTALSPLLEIRAADTVSRASHTVMLPGSGTAVKIEAWKANGGPEDLGLALDRISTLLRHNERDYGAFHGDRFVCLFPGADGGMEYNQGATTSWRALPHEVFHSWFARGVTPASQSDGWWDEGFTQFHDHGTDAVQPFDFREPPAQLCPRAPFARRTVRNAYTDGSRFFRGLAAALGPAGLRHAMRAVYARYAGRPLSTAQLEAELIAATGRPDLVDAFHRFVYGFADPTPSPRLSLAATPGHAAVWVRHADDGGQAPQAPLTGADNWFHARVRNDAAAGHCRHFAVVFSLTEAAGEEPSYPSGFGTPTTVACDFDLAPGEDRVICARWPRALAPDPGMGLRILAALHYRDGHPTPGTHVWEQPQLAQSHVVGR